jgi:hypothetical protein
MSLAEAVTVVANKGVVVAEEGHLLLAKFAFHDGGPPVASSQT